MGTEFALLTYKNHKCQSSEF